MADKQTTRPPLPLTLELSDLAVASVLGRGAKGVVFLVSSYSSGETFALKVISRSSLENNNAAAGSIRGGSAYRRIWFERDVLLALRHPLLPSLCGVVSTEKIVGFAINYCPGGDLNSLRRRQTEKLFSVDVIRFYAAELVLVLEYLHELGIIYRDLKPANILIQENGHIMLVDFDLSAKLQSAESPLITPFREAPRREPLFDQKKKKRSRSPFVCFTGITDVSPETLEAEESPWPPGSPAPAKSNSFVGTEEYVAPEMIEGNGHDFAVDWWCLGVVLYEMLYGRTPFRGQNRKETFYRIVLKPLELVGEPTALRDLIGRLLEKDPAKRIAIEEIRRHEFFRGVSWETVMRVERPPYMPVTVAKRDSGDEGLDLERVVEEFAMSTRAGREKVLEGKLEAEVRHSYSKNGHFAIF